MRLLSLPAILRAAGLTVIEIPGWRTRGSADWGPVEGIICHHTGGARTSSDAGEIDVLLHGSATAPPPIAQLYLSRAGRWAVVASGLCYHSLDGWGGPCRGLGNPRLLGIEAQHSGGTEPWAPVQYRSYVRGVGALCHALSVRPARVAGHKEHQPGDKSDPTFDMRPFRTAVAELVARPAALTQEDDVQLSDVIYKDANGKVRNVKDIAGSVDVRTGRTESAVATLTKKVDAVNGKIDALSARLDAVVKKLGG